MYIQNLAFLNRLRPSNTMYFARTHTRTTLVLHTLNATREFEKFLDPPTVQRTHEVVRTTRNKIASN